jgi:hypothetical protein
MTGSDLIDDVDGKLVDRVMNAEGRAFSDACYRGYLAEYEALFSGVPDYAVRDDPVTQAEVAAVLDRLYAAWVADGRPDPDGDHRDDAEPVGADDEYEPDPETMSRYAPDLERLLPLHLTEPPLRVNSVRASTWGSPRLTEALRAMDIEPSSATVVIAMGRRGPQVLTVTLYGVPTVSSERLITAIAPAITLPSGAQWEERAVAGRYVRWAEGPNFATAYWARDGLVTHVSGAAEAVQESIPLLP